MATSLVELLEQSILPLLTPDQVYPEVAFVRRSESAWRGPCPIHKGTDANFVVNPKYLTWTCYSHCGHGTAVSYLNGGESARGRDFVEIVRRLADLAGVAFPDVAQSPEAIEHANRRERRQRLLGSFLALASNVLMEPGGLPAREYLSARSIPIDFERLTSLDLGLYPSELGPLVRLGFSTKEIAEAGLAGWGWRGRIVGAWRDRYGGIATFFGRAITDGPHPKYLYLRDAPRPLLFGLPGLGSPAARPRTVVVVEGVFDAIQIRLGGIEAVGAIGSNSLSADRLKALEGIGIRELVLVPDADEAGTIGAANTARAWRSGHGGLRLSIVPSQFLAPHKDPDEFVRARGIDAFRAGLDRAIPANVFVATGIVATITQESPVRLRRDAIAQLQELVAELSSPRDTLDIEDIVRLAAIQTGYSVASVAGHLGFEGNIDDTLPRSGPVLSHSQEATSGAGVLNDGDEYGWVSTADWHPLLRAIFGDWVPQRSRPATDSELWTAVDEMGARTDRRRAQLLSLRYGRGGAAMSPRQCAPFIPRQDGGSGHLSASWIQQLEMKSLTRLRVRRYSTQLVQFSAASDFEAWQRRRRQDAKLAPPSLETRAYVATPIRRTEPGQVTKLHPARVGQPWSKDEEMRLRSAIELGQSVLDIAQAHQRTSGGINSRLHKLGLIELESD